jgi:hypothetical protein
VDLRPDMLLIVVCFGSAVDPKPDIGISVCFGSAVDSKPDMVFV